MNFYIVLVHGYTGSPDDLNPLSERLSEHFGDEALGNICLPGHGNHSDCPFDEQIFLRYISCELEDHADGNRRIVFIGHSTGGAIVLRYIKEASIVPEAVVLIATPKRISTDYFGRFEQNIDERRIALTDVARMVSTVNCAGRGRYRGAFPVLIVNGENDGLVPKEEASSWLTGSFDGPVRKVIMPAAEHDIFRGPGCELAIDVIRRFLADVAMQYGHKEHETASIFEAEPLMESFLSGSPLSKRHILGCPSGKKIYRSKQEMDFEAQNEPVFANIEVTTHCNLQCRFCARTHSGRESRHMSRHMFGSVLDLLPHAFQITLVGLGEPLLNPHIVDMVADASSRNRKVSLVTNAMPLDRSLSSAILDAGLSSIAFSLDASTHVLAAELRQGSRIETILENIRNFGEINRSRTRIPTAIFSAISVISAPHLRELVESVLGLDVDAHMVSDLNFENSVPYSLWQNIDGKMQQSIGKAIAHGFKNNLPVLSVRGLEEFGISRRYREFLLLPPGQLWNRSKTHTFCYSPWQTIPVGVNGDVTICDCQPEMVIGNLFQNPLSDIWQGYTIKRHRSLMRSDHPPDACRICPRF